MTNAATVSLIDGCRRGKEAAMSAFYERFYPYALSVCLAYADNREDARELLNDGFMKVFRRIGELKSEAALKPWLRTIMVNTAIDHYRRTTKTPTVSTEQIEQLVAEPYQNDEAILAQLSADHILDMIHRLPPAYRMVFSLYVLEGFSHHDIADQLRIAESTSRAHLTEANRLLRRALASQTHHTHEQHRR
ncbi:RNA polymerase sigma factor [Fibrella forsythiae]|uniref:Sigma-70 family RNA polymerase sigma factor n=1 Tax=Fibrella forsythiae TaxID=2817061 RepID=A0ABS3JQ05_9BACT|nr:sigma-70 family RNA polymerase sigma factor [Fibrella forsythiae]MBO0952090.1 sigma-70 family RNA polymerase sigma factor [Fibrella forsythiae]